VDLDARLTVTEAASLARVSKQLVNQWRRLGRISARHEGGRWTYRAGDVLTVERDMRRSPHSTRAA
jgi:predicted site-specific integrase-resolvase